MSDKSNSLKQPQGSLGKTIRNYKLELGMTVILIVLYIVLHAVTGTALGKGNVMNVLQSAAPLLIMTMGQLLVVITGGIDLSVGSVYSLSGMVGALVMLSTGSIAAGVAACLAVGLVCGVLNGLLVAKAKMAPFIVTLAMQGAAASLTKVISGGNSQTITLTAFKEFNRGTIVPGLKNYILYMIIIVIVMYFVLRKTSFGRWVYATGSNEGASHLVGIPVDRVKILCYTISAGLSSIAALLGASRLMTVECTAGVGMELDAMHRRRKLIRRTWKRIWRAYRYAAAKGYQQRNQPSWNQLLLVRHCHRHCHSGGCLCRQNCFTRQEKSIT